MAFPVQSPDLEPLPALDPMKGRAGWSVVVSHKSVRVTAFSAAILLIPPSHGAPGRPARPAAGGGSILKGLGGPGEPKPALAEGAAAG